jgi:hypothetical protein
MMKPGSLLRLSVKQEGLYILVRRILAPHLDLDLLAPAQLHRCMFEERRADDVDAADRINGVEAECAEDLPGRHLAFWCRLHRVPDKTPSVLLRVCRFQRNCGNEDRIFVSNDDGTAVSCAATSILYSWYRAGKVAPVCTKGRAEALPLVILMDTAVGDDLDCVILT